MCEPATMASSCSSSVPFSACVRARPLPRRLPHLPPCCCWGAGQTHRLQHQLQTPVSPSMALVSLVETVIAALTLPLSLEPTWTASGPMRAEALFCHLDQPAAMVWA